MTAKQKARGIRLLVLDVDGILTDGKVTYSADGTETKSFHIQDGLGIKLLMEAGIDVAIITGRVSEMVRKRTSELGIKTVIQGREDKLEALEELITDKGLELNTIAYMGDDLPDYRAMCSVGLALTASDAHPDIIDIADWQSCRSGGCGAVREACDLILRAQGLYETTTSRLKGND